MLPADLSGLHFLKWYYLPLPRILRELKDMTRDLKTNQHNLRMLTVAFSRTDLHLPAMAAVIPKNQSLSQVVPVLPTYKVNKSPSCRTLPALCCGLGTADKTWGSFRLPVRVCLPRADGSRCHNQLGISPRSMPWEWSHHICAVFSMWSSSQEQKEA